ncbi:hypothetical protein ACFL0G_03075 [Candidatus Zixiibacteriota bacterium]
MKKTERILIALFLSVACPASLFFLFWWAAGAIAIYQLLSFPERWIAIAGFAGLSAGVMLDILFLRRWTKGFYFFNATYLIFIYLFWSAIAMALFMGLPFLNLSLGAFAGLYVGRRHYHMAADSDDFDRTTRNAGLFTALVTGMETLLIGLLALREESVAEILGSLAGLSRSAARGPGGIAMVTGLTIILMGIQFWCTRRTAMFAFKLSR